MRSAFRGFQGLPRKLGWGHAEVDHATDEDGLEPEGFGLLDEFVAFGGGVDEELSGAGGGDLCGGCSGLPRACGTGHAARGTMGSTTAARSVGQSGQANAPASSSLGRSSHPSAPARRSGGAARRTGGISFRLGLKRMWGRRDALHPRQRLRWGEIDRCREGMYGDFSSTFLAPTA